MMVSQPQSGETTKGPREPFPRASSETAQLRESVGKAFLHSNWIKTEKNLARGPLVKLVGYSF